MTFGVGGGTGAGMSSRIIEKLSSEFRKKVILTFPVFHAEEMKELPLYSYNEVFSYATCVESCKKVIIDNSRIFEMTGSKKQDNYSKMNKMIVNVMSDITSTFRLGQGMIHSNLTEFE